MPIAKLKKEKFKALKISLNKLIFYKLYFDKIFQSAVNRLYIEFIITIYIKNKKKDNNIIFKIIKQKVNSNLHINIIHKKMF